MTVMIVWLVGQPDFSAILVLQSIPGRLYLTITSIALQNGAKGG
jgi:hypothetical protein